MSYNRKRAGSGPQSFGWGGSIIDVSAGDFDVSSSVKAIVLTSDGDVVCRPVNSASDISLVGLSAGYILPWHCSHIRQDGTTASLATVEG